MKSNKNDEVDVSKMIALEQELHDLKKENGVEEKEGRVSRAIKAVCVGDSVSRSFLDWIFGCYDDY